MEKPKRHRLSDVNMVDRTASCAKCGPVKIYSNKHSGVVCAAGVRAYQRLRLYGVTEADFARMLEEQDHSCAICHEPFIKTPHIDHSHATGKLRQLLCFQCNWKLAVVEDVDWAEKASAYLRRWEE